MKVTLMMVITADGYIAKNTSQASTTWTSSADKKIFVEKTKKAGVIIMGLATYKTINKPLPDRLNIILTREPEKETNIANQLEFTNKQPAELLEELEARGYQEAILGGGATINSLFLKAGLIDELQITIEPLLFGSGISLFKDLDLNQKLELIESQNLGGGVLNLRYKVIK